jgi:sugar lactone lactonase YvrE
MVLRVSQPLLFTVLILCFVSFPQQNPPPSAEDHFRPLIQQIERILPTLADRGAGLFALARLYAQAGDTQKATALLKETLATDQGFDPSGSEILAPLQANPEFAELSGKAQKRYPAVHKAKIAFTVPAEDLFPEGLAYDPAKHVFYMGSMYRRKIVRITENGAVSDFVRPDLYHLQPIGGVHVDPADHSLWAASDPDKAHGSELYHFDAQGKLLEQYSPPGDGRHDLNDLVLYHSSAIYVTDTDANLTYRFDRKSHVFTPLALPRPQLFPNGITLSDDFKRLYIADWLGVIMVDLRDNSTHEVHPGRHTTLSGIDGLYWDKNSLVGIQSAATFRVMRWFLSTDGWHVRTRKVLERGTSLVSFPTTGAIRGSRFYYMANTGIGNYNEGKIEDPSKLEPVHIAVVPLE